MIFLSKIENEIKLKLLNLFASLEDKPQQKDQNEHNMNNSSLEETIEWKGKLRLLHNAHR